MKRKPSRAVDVEKAARYAIIINGMQIGVLLLFVLYVAFRGITAENGLMIEIMAIVGSLMASWGAILDIREALQTRRRVRQIADLETSNSQMDTLNHTLRAQRHDFLNHLQVVYSLMEMQEYRDATDYLEKVYGEIRSVSSFLRTKSTAVNALLKVKAGACAEKGVDFQADIKSSLEGIKMPAWELCRVLGNLLDNAMDAAKADAQPQIRLSICEDIRSYRFEITNNGAVIPDELRSRLFEAGVTTKGDGHGMGLSIVSQTLEAYDGTVECESKDGRTTFVVSLPK